MRGVWPVCVAAMAFMAAAKQAIDYDALERQWEGGDMEDELLSDDELDYKRTGMLEKSEMVFVTLKESAIDAIVPVDPANSAVSELCASWKHMLMHGGLTVNFYELEAYKVLAGMQHGSRVKDVQAFLLDQDQVEAITWDQTTYYPKTNPSKKQRKKRQKSKKTASNVNKTPTQPDEL
ncbi:hypothetical protein DYB26_007129 [Aphanomyces astaci]|uniref:Uncharacterized protein n=1 Tax=Aphanomyces astaci TaxID=112090 RepID=A0A3R7C008_APHAT|nr:hypothetical protein DYB26_007129 [Aphanomyces astaci]